MDDQKRESLINGLHQCFSVEKKLIRDILKSHGWNVDKVLKVLQHLSPKCQVGDEGSSKGSKAVNQKAPPSSGKVVSKGTSSKTEIQKGQPGANFPQKSSSSRSVQQKDPDRQAKPGSKNDAKGKVPHQVGKPFKKINSKKGKDDEVNVKPPSAGPITSSMLAPNNAPPIIRSSEVVGGVPKKKSQANDLTVYYNLIKQKSDPVDRIRDYIKYQMRVVIMMRGCPGSGKSTLAQSLLTNNGIKRPDYYIFSADDFFIFKGEYRYNPSRIEEAHKWNQAAITRALKMGVSPVIVDNTHTQAWEMEAVSRLAVKYGYILEVVEPNTPWFCNESILAKRNVHGVPKAKIEDMLGRYEANITGNSLLQKFKLEYIPGLSPPQIVTQRDAAALIEKVRRQVPPPSTKTVKGKCNEDAAVDAKGIDQWVVVESFELAQAPNLLDFDDPATSSLDNMLTPIPTVPPTVQGTVETNSNYHLLSQITGPLELGAHAVESSKTPALSEYCLNKIQPLIELFPDTDPMYLWELYNENDEDVDLAIAHILEAANQSSEDSDTNSQTENESEEAIECQEEANDFDVAGILKAHGIELCNLYDQAFNEKEKSQVTKTSISPSSVQSTLETDKIETYVSLSSVRHALDDIALENDKRETNVSLPSVQRALEMDKEEPGKDSWSSEVNSKAESIVSFSKEQRSMNDADQCKDTSTNTNYRKKFVAPGDANDVLLNFTVNDESYSEHVRKIRKQKLGIVDEGPSKEDGLSSGVEDDLLAVELRNTEDNIDMEDDLLQKNEEDIVTFAVDASLVSQLQEQFGGITPGSNSLNKLWVNLPVNLARQLHSYVMDSVYSNLDDENITYGAMTDEDELLARQIQELEGGIPDNPGMPTLQEIMDTELALNLHRSLNKEPSKRDTMAGKLSEQLLIERFPNMDPAALKAILEDADHSLHQATQILEVAGYTPKSVEKAFSVQEPEDNRISREEVVQQASAYKEAAKVLFDLRNEYLSKAQKAYGDGLKSVASYYSQMAQWHEQRLGEANVLASSLLLSGSKDGVTLDLHFLRVQDALQVLDLFLDAQVNNLGENRQRRKELYIITGRGLHSAGGRSKIRPAVLNRLKQRSIQSEQINPGLFKITITPKTALTCQKIHQT